MTDFEIYLKINYLIILLGNMPSKPIDYRKTHVYKIVCKDTDIADCYIGHTTDFTKRKSKHKNHCNSATTRVHNMPVYHFIRENGGWVNWDMVLINTTECENSLEAKKTRKRIHRRIERYT